MHSQKEIIIMDFEDNIGFIKQEISKGQKIEIQTGKIRGSEGFGASRRRWYRSGSGDNRGR